MWKISGMCWVLFCTFSSIICCKDYPFCSELPLPFFQGSVDHILWIFSGFSTVCSSICISTLSPKSCPPDYSKSWNQVLRVLKSVFNVTVLAILDLLPFYTNFRVTLSMSTKQLPRIFMGVALNQQIKSERANSLKILSLPTHEQRILSIYLECCLLSSVF